MSPSALSHLVKSLETRLGVRLLTRTTRSVAPTEAGVRLLREIVPAFGRVEEALAKLSEHRDVPAGTVRVTAVKHAIRSVLSPNLSGFFKRYPDIAVEFAADDSLADIVAEGFDAGVRLGERVDRDMISIRISPEIPTALVAAPSYFDRHPPPASPHDLTGHDCIGHRTGSGALHPWPFQRDGREFLVKVRGRLALNDSDLILDSALAGHGLAYLFADQVIEHRRSDRLVGVLDDWTMTHAGYFFYYASRRQQPPALAALIDWFRVNTSAARS